MTGENDSIAEHPEENYRRRPIGPSGGVSRRHKSVISTHVCDCHL